jgi:hypothetical protein
MAAAFSSTVLTPVQWFAHHENHRDTVVPEQLIKFRWRRIDGAR